MKAIIIDNVLHFQEEYINKNYFNRIINVRGATDQEWYDWGFREYVVPVYTNLQKLGTVFFDTVSDTITYPVIDKTQVEIDADTEALIVSSIQQQLDTYESDGRDYFQHIRNYVQRNYNEAVITQAQFLSIRKTLEPALLPLKDGNWDIAQSNINAITPPVNVKLLFLYNKVKSAIDTYILTGNVTTTTTTTII